MTTARTSVLRRGASVLFRSSLTGGSSPTQFADVDVSSRSAVACRESLKEGRFVLKRTIAELNHVDRRASPQIATRQFL